MIVSWNILYNNDNIIKVVERAIGLGSMHDNEAHSAGDTGIGVFLAHIAAAWCDALWIRHLANCRPQS